ncbi:uncharacterized protein LOC134536105 [Bacillus rossius redtenbacheri]|uniref:uncharacterized protein LOC134536105 n=1 Tax=Bacillus rossius redtenbacheri TaxID=93214 RepID=UPI002FDD7A8E
MLTVAAMLLITAATVEPGQSASLGGGEVTPQLVFNSHFTRFAHKTRAAALSDALLATSWAGNTSPQVLFKMEGSDRLFTAGDIIGALPFLPIEINVPDMLSAIRRFFQQFFSQSQAKLKLKDAILYGENVECYYLPRDRQNANPDGFVFYCTKIYRLEPDYVTAILLPMQEFIVSPPI